jgi:hypothetical protein
MEENLKERVEVQIENEGEYTVDLSEKRVIIFSGDTYKLANIIPQFIMDCRGGVCSDSEEIPPFSLKYFLPGKDIKEEGSGNEIIQFPNTTSKVNRSILSGKTSYSFFRDIEYGRSAYEQIDYIDYIIGKFNWWNIYSDKILVSTHSPYVLNYMNVIMARDQGLAKKISGYYVSDDIVQCLDSTCNVTERRILNTLDLSEPMEDIWELYDEIKV